MKMGWLEMGTFEIKFILVTRKSQYITSDVNTFHNAAWSGSKSDIHDRYVTYEVNAVNVKDLLCDTMNEL